MPETNPQVLHSRGLHGVPKNKLQSFVQRIRLMKEPSIMRVLTAGPMKQRGLQATTKVLYTGIFFDAPSKRRIAETFLKNARIESLLNNVCNFHVTTKFLPTKDCVEAVGVGMKVSVEITGFYAHREVQILTVGKIGNGFEAKVGNEVPHITISTRNVQPSVANHALKHCTPVAIEPPVVVHGVVGAFMRGSGDILTDIKALPKDWDVLPPRGGGGRRSNRGSRSPSSPSARRSDKERSSSHGRGRRPSSGNSRRTRRLGQSSTPSPRRRSIGRGAATTPDGFSNRPYETAPAEHEGKARSGDGAYRVSRPTGHSAAARRSNGVGASNESGRSSGWHDNNFSARMSS